MKEKKEYIVTYRSQEHYEVLGWITASSIKDAQKKVQKELLKESKYYKVADAKIAEWKDSQNINFNTF